MDILQENELIKKIQQKDKFAENNFISAYYPKIKMLIAMKINQFEDREELANDILVAAVLKIRNGKFDLERDSSLSKYIYGITRNTINQYFKDYYKKRGRDERLQNELLGNSLNANVERYEFEKTEEIKQNKKIWRNLIEQLKPKYREVVYLRYYDNLSVSEIGEKLNISPQKVSDYLKYSKQLLMERYPNI